MPHFASPPSLADELRRLTVSELSLASRLRYVALLLGASTMSAVALALLLTEPELPQRTAIALSVMETIGVCWVIFAAWVLTRRRALLGTQHIIAGRLAVTFSGVFAVGALVIGLATARPAAFAAAAMGAVMLCVAGGIFLRARRRHALLAKRRDELTRLLRRRN